MDVCMHPSAHLSIHPSVADKNPYHLEVLAFLTLLIIFLFCRSHRTIWDFLLNHLQTENKTPISGEQQIWYQTFPKKAEKSRHCILICLLATFFCQNVSAFLSLYDSPPPPVFNTFFSKAKQSRAHRDRRKPLRAPVEEVTSTNCWIGRAFVLI